MLVLLLISSFSLSLSLYVLSVKICSLQYLSSILLFFPWNRVKLFFFQTNIVFLMSWLENWHTQSDLHRGLDTSTISGIRRGSHGGSNSLCAVGPDTSRSAPKGWFFIAESACQLLTFPSNVNSLQFGRPSAATGNVRATDVWNQKVSQSRPSALWPGLTLCLRLTEVRNASN